MGPINFTMAISKVKALHPIELILKYVDDCNVVLILTTNSDMFKSKIEHSSAWAESFNLKLYHLKKTQELIIPKPGEGLGEKVQHWAWPGWVN